MPIRVRSSSELGLVVIIFEGVVTTQEIEFELAPLIEVPEFSLLPLALFDMTGATQLDGPSDVIRDGARRVTDAVDTQVESGSKLALVATSDEFFGLGRMYQTFRDGSPVELKIFRSLAEGEEWLGLRDGYAEQLTDVG